MCCSRDSPRTQACGPECIFGLGWTGTWRTRTGRSFFRCGGTSVLESHSNFVCTFGEGIEGKGGKMKKRSLLLLALASFIVVRAAQAQIKHIEMRVEGMT